MHMHALHSQLRGHQQAKLISECVQVKPVTMISLDPEKASYGPRIAHRGLKFPKFSGGELQTLIGG